MCLKVGIIIRHAIGPDQGLLELTGLLSGTQSLKCGGDTERGYSARDNETPERSPKAKVRLGYDVRDDWIYKYIHVAQSLFLLGIISLQQCITIRSIFLQLSSIYRSSSILSSHCRKHKFKRFASQYRKPFKCNIIKIFYIWNEFEVNNDKKKKKIFVCLFVWFLNVLVNY